MGWLSCYKALEEAGCATGLELLKVNPQRYEAANKTNIAGGPGNAADAWRLAERKLEAVKSK